MMGPLATAEAALAFVNKNGIVLASAKGSAPRLTEAIVGEPIQGSWWSHAESRRIFVVLSAVEDSDQVLVCRLLERKITLVHRRLWPALVRLADRFTPEQIAQVKEEHTASGRHVSRAIPFPRWVPRDVMEQARRVAEEDAARLLRPWLPQSVPPARASEGESTGRPKRRRTNREITS